MKNVMTAIAGLGLAVCLSGSAHAAGPNLVTNGDFESLTNGIGQIGYNTDATGWYTNGYNFAFSGNTADSTGSSGSYGHLELWGPSNGSANGLGASPTGGNYIGADGAFEVGAITQTISGLQVGKTYNVDFSWAAAQQKGYDGDTTDKWTVGLGDEKYDTAVVSLPSHSFSGWMHQTFTYTATSTSETLSFLATGTPAGVPPFALLDGVSVTATPEASSVISVFAGMMFLGVIMLRGARAKKSIS